jgi:bifunctional UDP-N-acetylglucosamine pyrophosphorylase/glucosamine-1-phosphate N-acetyltransferase
LNRLASIILAAGKGTRMKSRYPKVLHKVCGQPMVRHVTDAARGAGVEYNIVVIGHGAEAVKEALAGQAEFVVQAEQLGTGHAVMQAEEKLLDFTGDILVLCGDTPLITSGTLSRLLTYHRDQGSAATVLTAELTDPGAYGRIIRDENNQVARIVEQKDASAEELAVREINTGMYCFNAPGLFAALKKITPANAQGEYYLTDVLEIFRSAGEKVAGIVVEDSSEIMGINNRLQLAEAEQAMRRRVLERFMLEGVTIKHPDSTYIDPRAEIGPDTVIYPYTSIEGNCRIGENCRIGPGTRLVAAEIGDEVTVQNSIILESTVGSGSAIGPFAYIRPETMLAEGVKVGDFVEIKKSVIGKGSKVPHLSYVGDSLVGEKVNIGAGTITCNYDGRKKSRTVIGDGAFIGSNTNLVAPVEIGADAVTAAGSTITKRVPDGALAVERSKQINLEGWAARKNN